MAVGVGPSACDTDARGRHGQVRLDWAGAGVEPVADELPQISRLNATNPDLSFDGTPVRGGSG
eukprot:2820179-Prymnesium_polylepis.1